MLIYQRVILAPFFDEHIWGMAQAQRPLEEQLTLAPAREEARNVQHVKHVITGEIYMYIYIYIYVYVGKL